MPLRIGKIAKLFVLIAFMESLIILAPINSALADDPAAPANPRTAAKNVYAMVSVSSCRNNWPRPAPNVTRIESSLWRCEA